ncbi:MAG: hypothetical protein D8M57_07300 [Candidatus Scalindua sp. AMX11]|nr:MAG: hypothetical protein DWQ00_05550 [Candidatus Scalindua sp.]NOG82464.1 hypothetical protein [Planctomycetota bacterium]RZV93898.1 MAG: hypothetical protein EX341_03315 [Candidatus Scalindua sp. SCAELEC01]TDE65518.1 MAG: hypothetical protein D8M57_07300 [Candidatus Scalindua sp. AMX11]GJQ58100.1 MAG: hypothetical protein SCALA701_09010 [Candidatus Scalindua sp.]
MNFLLKRDSCCRLAFALVLVITLYGCQTTSNTLTDESTVSNLQSKSTKADTKSSEIVSKDTELKERGKRVTEKAAGEVSAKPSEKQKRSLEGFEDNFMSNLSGYLGHGGVSRGRTEKETEKVNANKKAIEAEETKSFPELEKKVVGKWLNEKETESMQYFDNKTIIINDEGTQQMIKGTFRFTEKDSLTVDFNEGFLKVPSMSFKITISENELTLIGLTDGVPTVYKRVK